MTSVRKILISENEWLDMVHTFQGFCFRCWEWTRDNTEPDAEGYECPCCGELFVYGAELVLIMGLIEFKKELK